jgi:integrase
VDTFLGRTNTDLCPVAALLEYVAIRPKHPGPLFLFKDWSFLTRDKLVTAVSLVFRQAGLNPSEYSGHSFRNGAATRAAQVGIEDSVVKMLGRWESSAYQRYIRTPRDTLAAVSACLARGLH